MIKNIIVDGFDTGYSVDDKGYVYNSKGSIRGSLSSAGYMQVYIPYNGKYRWVSVHRLVARYFLPNDDPKHKNEVHHKDGNKLNNRVENLEWTDGSEHGLRSYFENDSSLTRYSEDTILNIVKAIEKGKWSPAKIAKKFNVDIRLVHNIKNGESFKKYTENIDMNDYNNKFHQKKRIAEKRFVFKLLKAGFPPDLIIRQIKDQFAYDDEEANYVYNYLLRDKDKIIPYINTKFSADRRYKYDDYMETIENMLLDGNMPRRDIVKWAMTNIGIEKHKADDLIRQRIRALINGNSIIDTSSRSTDLDRLSREHNESVSNRAERKILVGQLNEKIDKMLLEGVDHETIVQFIRDSGIITGKTGRADNCRMQVTKRKFYLKKHGLLKD